MAETTEDLEKLLRDANGGKGFPQETVSSVQTELVDGLRLTPETAAATVRLHEHSSSHLEQLDVPALKEDMRTIGGLFVDTAISSGENYSKSIMEGIREDDEGNAWSHIPEPVGNSSIAMHYWGYSTADWATTLTSVGAETFASRLENAEAAKTFIEAAGERLFPAAVAFGCQADAVQSVLVAGTADDLKEMLAPYLKDGLDKTCDMLAEAAGSGTLNENLDICALGRVLSDIADCPCLTDPAKEELAGTIIKEEVSNKDFGIRLLETVLPDIFEHPHLTDLGKEELSMIATEGLAVPGTARILDGLRDETYDGTLNEIDTVAYNFLYDAPPELYYRGEDFFNTLAEDYASGINGMIYDTIEDVVANHPDRLEELAVVGKDGSLNLDRMIQYAFAPDEERCDQHLLDIRDTVKDFAESGGEADSREEVIEKVTGLLDEYLEGLRDSGAADRPEYYDPVDIPEEYGEYHEKTYPSYMNEEWVSDMQQQIIDGYIGTHGSPREFEIFVGPTNSGKTHDALDALSNAESGVYLSPLRLLAAETAAELNGPRGVPCSLLTGEEHSDVKGARHVSSTIEMLDMGRHYDVAVIDEAQMIGDDKRGGAWTRAILGVDADKVYVCCAPEAEQLVKNLIGVAGDMCVGTHHLERLSGMEFDGKVGYEDVKPHDALVSFSARGVESTASRLEDMGFKCSRIYGAMPPEMRAREEERFSSGKTDVVVSTDAIGMGLNLPIERVIFTETSKFDGSRVRDLMPTEIKQIAGRAGRFGLYDTGHYATFAYPDFVKNGYEAEPDTISRAYLDIPHSMFEANEYVSDVYLKFASAVSVEGSIFTNEDVMGKAGLATILEYDLWLGINTADAKDEFFEKAEEKGYGNGHNEWYYDGYQTWLEARGKIDVEGLIDTKGMLSDTIREFSEFPVNTGNEKVMSRWEELFRMEITGESDEIDIREFCDADPYDLNYEMPYESQSWIEDRIKVCDMVSYYERHFGTEKGYQEARECRNEFIKELSGRLDAKDEPDDKVDAGPDAGGRNEADAEDADGPGTESGHAADSLADDGGVPDKPGDGVSGEEDADSRDDDMSWLLDVAEPDVIRDALEDPGDDGMVDEDGWDGTDAGTDEDEEDDYDDSWRVD